MSIRNRAIMYSFIACAITQWICYAEEALTVKNEIIDLSHIEHAVTLILNDAEYTLLQQYAATVQGEEKDALHAMLSNEYNEMYNQLYGNFWGYFDNDGFSITWHSILLLVVGFFGMQKDSLEQQRLLALKGVDFQLQKMLLLKQQMGHPQAKLDQITVAVDSSAAAVRAQDSPSKFEMISKLLFSIGLFLPLGYGIIRTYNCTFNAEQIKKKERINNVLLLLQKT